MYNGSLYNYNVLVIREGSRGLICFSLILNITIIEFFFFFFIDRFQFDGHYNIWQVYLVFPTLMVTFLLTKNTKYNLLLFFPKRSID